MSQIMHCQQIGDIQEIAVPANGQTYMQPLFEKKRQVMADWMMSDV